MIGCPLPMQQNLETENRQRSTVFALLQNKIQCSELKVMPHVLFQEVICFVCRNVHCVLVNL